MNPAIRAQADETAPACTPFPFRWVLPFGQLLLCAALLWQARAFIAWEFGVTLPPLVLIPRSFVQSDTALSAVAALNLPSGLIQLPYDILSPEHSEWRPAGMDLRIWRAITWPFIGLVFWWLPGRGIEALLAVKYGQLAPRISWKETIVGFLVMIAGAMVFIAFFIVGRSDPAGRKFAAAGGLWIFLGGLSIVARIAQWRLRKKLASSQERTKVPPGI